MRSLSPEPNRGFTITEVIVAMVVLGLLVVLALPAVRRARQEVDRVGCVGNLRQIGVALQLYAGENRDYLPGPEYSIVNLRGNLVTKLWPYFREDAAWRCPANRTMDAAFSTYRTRTPFFGYYYAPPRESLPGWRRAEIQATYPPEQQWIIEDIDAWNYAPQPRLGKAAEGPVHPGMRNRLFVDGRVEKATAERPTP